MSKTKRSHYRSEEKLDESDDQRIAQSDESIEQKKRKKSSKKSKKHRQKRKASTSDSDSESSSSSSSSESSSDSSSEEEVKRKKQKKHKKNKRRNRHDSNERSAKGSRTDKHIDDDDDVKVLHDSAKVHYVSSGEDEKNRKPMRRRDENDRKRIKYSPGNERMEFKSKWDSPSEDFERKRFRDDRRVEERGRIDRSGGSERERHDNYRERNRQSPPPQQRERPDFGDRRNDRRPMEGNYRDRQDQRPGLNDWRPRDRRQDNQDRFRRPEQDRRPRFEDNRNFNRQDNRNRFGNDDGRRDRNDMRRPNFNNDRRFQSNERDRGAERPFRRDEPPRERSHSNRDRFDRSPKKERERSPIRENPFRRNNNLNKPSDFRPEEERPDRNDNRSEEGNSRGNSRDNSRGNSHGNSRDNSRHSSRDRNNKRKAGGDGGSAGRRRKFEDKNSDNENYEWGKSGDGDKKEENNEPIEKEKPNFGLSGKLTEDTNTVNGVTLKYAEPPEARRPKRRWRLYPFKGTDPLPTLHIHRQSCYLIGRDKKVCDLSVDHPSCSKQHAALQYRLVPYEREDGTTGKHVRPYIIDLGSANGTFLNNKPIEPKKYYELFEKDMLKFGFSSREYVLLHENSNGDDAEPFDDEADVKLEK